MADSVANNRDNSQPNQGANRVGAWLGVISTIVTVSLSVWAAFINNSVKVVERDLQRQQFTLEMQKREIEQAELQLKQESSDVERYEYIRERLTDLSSDNATTRAFTINLFQVVLNPDEYTSLFEGLSISQDVALSQAGTTALAQLEVLEENRQEQVNALVDSINSVSQDERRSATHALKNQHSSSAYAVDSILEWFEEDPENLRNIENLSASGRINSLFVLANTELQAWSPESLDDARQAVERMETRHSQGTSIIGAETRTYLDSLRRHLAYVQSSQSS